MKKDNCEANVLFFILQFRLLSLFSLYNKPTSHHAVVLMVEVPQQPDKTSLIPRH